VTQGIGESSFPLRAAKRNQAAGRPAGNESRCTPSRTPLLNTAELDSALPKTSR